MTFFFRQKYINIYRQQTIANAKKVIFFLIFVFRQKQFKIFQAPKKCKTFLFRIITT